jgi:hypothetical protein
MRDIVDDEQRRRRAVTPCRPSGCGGMGPYRTLPHLTDAPASPAVRRLHLPPWRLQRDRLHFYHGLLADWFSKPLSNRQTAQPNGSCAVHCRTSSRLFWGRRASNKPAGKSSELSSEWSVG